MSCVTLSLTSYHCPCPSYFNTPQTHSRFVPPHSYPHSLTPHILTPHTYLYPSHFSNPPTDDLAPGVQVVISPSLPLKLCEEPKRTYITSSALPASSAHGSSPLAMSSTSWTTKSSCVKPTMKLQEQKVSAHVAALQHSYKTEGYDNLLC